MNRNPKLEVGQKIILLKTNLYPDKLFENKVLSVVSVCGNTEYRTESMDGRIIIIDSNYDSYILATRQSRIEYTLEKLTKAKEVVEKLQREYNTLIKYESDEEEVADKIDQLMKADGIKAKAKILKELKKSNYL